MAQADLEIRAGLVIPGDEIIETASRSSGPGGQHVNKTSTRVTLRWRPESSSALTPQQCQRIVERLASRLTTRGSLVVHAGNDRSRARNRDQARLRLADLVRDALRVERNRVATRQSKASKSRGLETKRRRGQVKRGRGRVRGDDG